jgi:Ca2+-transporting ATPase
MKQFYNQDIAEVLDQFRTDEKEGLTIDEASRRLEEYGYNQLESKRKKTFFRMFITQFRSFMTRGMICRVMYQGIMIGCIPLAAYIIGLREGGQILGQTMAFATLSFAELIHVRNLHSNTRSSLAISPFRNKPLLAAIFISGAPALLVLSVPPIRDAFSLTSLDGKHWMIVILMSLIPLVVVDIFKLFRINGARNEY